MNLLVLDPVVGPSGFLYAWAFDPVVVVALLVAAWAYGYGVRRLWNGGRGRGVGPAQVTAFFFGLVALATALVSPVAALGHTLFAAHRRRAFARSVDERFRADQRCGRSVARARRCARPQRF